MLNIEETSLIVLRQVLKKYPYNFYAFGSRVKKEYRKYSDLDICYKEEIPAKDLVEIMHELEESNIPFRVDLVYWENMSREFQKLIEKDLVLI